MDLPSFNLLWETSEKLSELETVLDELDKSACNAVGKKRKRRRRDGLYGTAFDIEDKDYYEPLKYCCDDAFYTEEEFTRHVQLHSECPVESCQFIANPKLMRLHKEVVHAGENYEVIYPDASDKAVLKWREARKSNYPTLERTLAKKEAYARKVERGEIFETKQFGALQKKKAPLLKPIKATKPASDCAPTTSSSDVVGLVPVDYGLSDNDGVEEQNGGGTDEKEVETKPSADNLPEEEHQRRGRRRRGGRRRTGRRGRLAGSASDENAEPTQRTSDAADATDEDLVVRDAEPVCNEDLVEMKQDPVPAAPLRSKNPFSAHPVVQMAARRLKFSRDSRRIYSRPTLLHMLLAPEIRRERNHLMQCIRYVIQHNFFLDQPDHPSAPRETG